MRPRTPRPGGTRTQQGPAGSGPGLRELLGDHDAHGAAGVDGLGAGPSAATTPRSASMPKPASRAKAMPSSIVSNVCPSNRSGVCTVCPACRNSSANDRTPSVSP